MPASRTVPERGTILDPLPVTSCSGESFALDPARALIVFYRGFWCEHCRAQMLELAQLAPAFREVGFSLAAISSDSAVLAEAMCSMVRGELTILRDPNAGLIARFGLLDHDDAVEHVIARPAVFIVGADRTIEFRYVSRSAEDRPTGNLLLLGAESLSASVIQ